LRPRPYLEILAQAPRALVIHGNYLDAADHAFLATHADRMAVVYCPRTHHFFGHSPYPLAPLLAAGVTVALGTDGRGTNPDLSLLAEMQHVARAHPDVSPEAIVRLGTLGGAEALGCADRVGSLVPGKEANLVAVALPDHENSDPCAPLLHSPADVIMTIRHGRMVYAQPSVDAT
jgi:cytosine/adenosine deaminase-related metal-dependent hydrolase